MFSTCDSGSIGKDDAFAGAQLRLRECFRGDPYGQSQRT
jgi:hypothetical protein